MADIIDFEQRRIARAKADPKLQAQIAMKAACDFADKAISVGMTGFDFQIQAGPQMFVVSIQEVETEPDEHDPIRHA